MLEKYKKHIVPNPNVELIHASYDEMEDKALQWAKKAKFTWPTILMSDWEAVGLQDYGAFAGELRLVDSSGKVITDDEDEAFTKIAALK